MGAPVIVDLDEVAYRLGQRLHHIGSLTYESNPSWPDVETRHVIDEVIPSRWEVESGEIRLSGSSHGVA